MKRARSSVSNSISVTVIAKTRGHILPFISCTCLLSAFVSAFLYAAPASAIELLATKIEEKPHFQFSSKLGMSSLQSLINKQDGSKKSLNFYSLDADFAYTNYGSVSLSMAYLADLKNSEASDFYESEVRYNFESISLHEGKNWKTNWSNNFGIVIPTSKDAIQNQQMLGGLVAATGFSLEKKGGLLTQSYSLEFEAYRNFYQYETTYDHKSNVAWTLDQTLAASIGYQSFSVFGMLLHIDNFDYEKNVEGLFKHKEGVGFSPIKNFSIQIGHTNSGNIFRANGYSSNFKLIDEDSSLYFIKLGVTI